MPVGKCTSATAYQALQCKLLPLEPSCDTDLHAMQVDNFCVVISKLFQIVDASIIQSSNAGRIHEGLLLVHNRTVKDRIPDRGALVACSRTYVGMCTTLSIDPTAFNNHCPLQVNGIAECSAE